MAITVDHFITFNRPTGTVFVKTETLAGRYTAGALISTTPTRLGIPAWLHLPPLLTANHFYTPNLTDSGVLVWSMVVQFSNTDIVLGDSIDFLACWDPSKSTKEWGLRLVGGGFPGGDHKVVLVDANGALTDLVEGPFSDNTPYLIDCVWEHTNSAVFDFYVNGVRQAVVLKDLLATAGDFVCVWEGQPQGIGDPGASEVFVGLPVFHKNAISGDWPAPRYEGRTFRPAWKKGLVADCEETGASPGDTGTSGDAANIADDDLDTAFEYLPPSVNDARGFGFACDQKRSVAGPAGNYGPTIVPVCAKFSITYIFPTRGSDPDDPYILFGRFDGVSDYDVTKVLKSRGANQSEREFLLPGAGEFPGIQTHYGVVGFYHLAEAATSFGLFEGWVDYLTEYDASDTGPTLTVVRGLTDLQGTMAIAGN